MKSRALTPSVLFQAFRSVPLCVPGLICAVVFQTAVSQAASQRKIAYCSNANGQWDLYVMNDDGSGKTQITFFPANVGSPHWSPDGSRILFVSSGGQAYLVNPDGSGLIQVTSPGMDISPTPGSLESIGWAGWSPDGQWIPFSARISGQYFLCKIRTDGTQFTKLAIPSDDSYCTGFFSPDGSKVVFSKESGGWFNPWVVNSDGTGEHAPDSRVQTGSPAWFSTSDKLVYFYCADVDEPCDIYWAPVDGSAHNLITSLGIGGGASRVLPGDTRLLHTIYQGEQNKFGVVNMDGTGLRWIEQGDVGLSEYGPAYEWCADNGGKILYFLKVNGYWDICTNNLNGTNRDNLTSTSMIDEAQPSFSPVSTSFATVAKWGLDEGSGTTVHDSSGNHYDGTQTSSANWGSSAIDKFKMHKLGTDSTRQSLDSIFVYTTGGETILYQDNFDSYVVGDVPAGWNRFHNALTESSNNAVTNVRSLSAPNSFQAKGSYFGRWAANMAHPMDLGGRTGLLVLEGKICSSGDVEVSNSGHGNESSLGLSCSDTGESGVVGVATGYGDTKGDNIGWISAPAGSMNLVYNR